MFPYKRLILLISLRRTQPIGKTVNGCFTPAGHGGTPEPEHANQRCMILAGIKKGRHSVREGSMA